MYRSLIPSVLISLGYALFFSVSSMPIFDWRISELTSDLPPTYDIYLQPMPLVTRAGESLDQNISVLSQKISVLKNGEKCRLEDLNFVVKRTQRDKTLERVVLNLNKNSPTLIEWVFISLILSIIYIWWFAIWYKRPLWAAIGFAIVFTLIIGISFLGLTQILRILLPRVAPLGASGILDCHDVTITLLASLSGVHYDTLIVFLMQYLRQN